VIDAQIVQDAISFLALCGLVWYVLELRRQNAHTRNLVVQAEAQARSATEQVKELAAERDGATRARLTSVYQNITMQMHDIHRLFIDNPRLKRYFYENESQTKGDADSDRVACIAEMLVDFMDNVLVQAPTLESMPALSGWCDYFKYLYRHSPAIRDYWARRHTWYTDDLGKLLEEASREMALLQQSNTDPT
jgi:hypothetical protein